MKKNAHKLLILLYQTEPQPALIDQGNLRWCFPELSDSGWRSLGYWLQQQQLITIVKLNGETRLGITAKGQLALKQAFPALDDKWDRWAGEWYGLAFIKAPKGDPEFRYLRQLVLSHGGIALSRGFYVFAHSVPEKVHWECQHTYILSASIFAIGSWLNGDPTTLMVKQQHLGDLATSLSGLSSELSNLLTSISLKKELNDHDKNEFISIFDRYLNVLRDDLGVVTYYIPHSISSRQVQQLIRKIFRVIG